MLAAHRHLFAMELRGNFVSEGGGTFPPRWRSYYEEERSKTRCSERVER